MGRFSPSTQPIQSWTQGLSEGMGDLAQSLIQRRQFNLQKQRQTFDENIQTQNEARENAQAGYTPAQPYGPMTQNTPEGLDRISNAGVADAGTPASYDPTKSAGYAIWQPRLQNSLDRAQISADARTQAADIHGQYGLQNINARYGSMDANGNYTPGAQVQGQEAVKQQGLDFQQGFHDQIANQFSRKLGETTRHDQAMEARPVGGSNRMSTGGAAGPTATERTAINNNTAKYQLPQKVPGRLNADGSSFTTRTVPGLTPQAASAKAVHNVNMTRQAFGQDTLANPASMPDSALARAARKVNPDAAAGVERDGTAASKAAAPVHGAQTPLHPGTNKTKQELPSTSQGIPASPTDDNAPHPNVKAFTDMSALYQKHQATIDGRTDLSPAGKAQLKKQLSDAYNQQMTTIAQQK